MTLNEGSPPKRIPITIIKFKKVVERNPHRKLLNFLLENCSLIKMESRTKRGTKSKTKSMQRPWKKSKTIPNRFTTDCWPKTSRVTSDERKVLLVNLTWALTRRWKENLSRVNYQTWKCTSPLPRQVAPCWVSSWTYWKVGVSIKRPVNMV